MFNPEKLLQKVISEMAGSANIVHSKKHKKKKKKKRKAKGLSDALVSNLTSGKGLMAAIALGVGAYTIAKGTKNSTVATRSSAPLPPPQSSTQATPPPIPGKTAATEAVSEPPPQADEGKKLAVRLIQVMIAAAWADGEIDAEEESKILQKLQGQQLDSEEKIFLLNELHAPKTIAQLTANIDDPRIAQAMYSLAVATLVIDTGEERVWLDKFAATLGLSPEMQSFIEEEIS